MNFAKIIKARRIELGLSKKKLADMIGKKRFTIDTLEKDEAGVSHRVIQDICDALELRPYECGDLTYPEWNLMNLARAVRRDKKIKQRELADKVGVNVQTINKFERGKHALNSKTLEKIFDELNLKVG